MMNVSEIELYNVIRNNIGEKEAETIVAFVKNEVREKVNDQKDHLASKTDVANTKADIIKWMFIFWVGQVAAMFALIKIL